MTPHNFYALDNGENCEWPLNVYNLQNELHQKIITWRIISHINEEKNSTFIRLLRGHNQLVTDYDVSRRIGRFQRKATKSINTKLLLKKSKQAASRIITAILH